MMWQMQFKTGTIVVWKINAVSLVLGDISASHVRTLRVHVDEVSLGFTDRDTRTGLVPSLTRGDIVITP